MPIIFFYVWWCNRRSKVRQKCVKTCITLIYCLSFLIALENKNGWQRYRTRMDDNPIVPEWMTTIQYQNGWQPFSSRTDDHHIVEEWMTKKKKFNKTIYNRQYETDMLGYLRRNKHKDLHETRWADITNIIIQSTHRWMWSYIIKTI